MIHKVNFGWLTIFNVLVHAFLHLLTINNFRQLGWFTLTISYHDYVHKWYTNAFNLISILNMIIWLRECLMYWIVCLHVKMKTEYWRWHWQEVILYTENWMLIKNHLVNSKRLIERDSYCVIARSHFCIINNILATGFHFSSNPLDFSIVLDFSSAEKFQFLSL